MSDGCRTEVTRRRSDQHRFLELALHANAVWWSRRTESQSAEELDAPYRERHSMIVFDAGKMRPYRAADLDRLLRFVGECNRVPTLERSRHPGDVIHFMSNTLRGHDLERHIFLYEESDRATARAGDALPRRDVVATSCCSTPDLRLPMTAPSRRRRLVWAGDAAWSASQATGSAPEGARRARKAARSAWN